jgi:prolyl 4-hydroxylase
VGVSHLFFCVSEGKNIYRHIFIYMEKVLNESWKNWVTENLALGIPTQKIFETLVNNDFDLNDIESVIKESPGKLPISKIPKSSSSSIRPGSYIEGAKKVDVPNDALELYTIDNFLNAADCKTLVSLIKTDMKKSTVSFASKASGHYDKETRTSSTCSLKRSTDDVVTKVDNLILECIGIHSSRGEPIQGQHYDKTQQFKQHTDTFAPNSEEYKLHADNRGGQRTWTFMIYLNSTRKGGETKFNRIKDKDGNELSFKPKTGMAVVWDNLKQDGSPNQYSLHQGCPVESGEKIIITKWFRERKV